MRSHPVGVIRLQSGDLGLKSPGIFSGLRTVGLSPRHLKASTSHMAAPYCLHVDFLAEELGFLYGGEGFPMRYSLRTEQGIGPELFLPPSDG